MEEDSSSLEEYIEQDIRYEYSNDPNQIKLNGLDVQPLETKNTAILTRPRNRSRSHSEINTLNMFKTKSDKEPKKENIRLQVIRAYKRSIREALDCKIPKSKIHSVDIKSENSMLKWKIYAEYIREKRKIFENISRTELGPMTDGRTRRKNIVEDIKDKADRSFNDTFCLKFFFSPGVLLLYAKYIDLVFDGLTCKELGKNFEHCPKICKKKIGVSVHKGERKCMLAWENLKEYLKSGMLKDIGVNVEEEFA